MSFLTTLWQFIMISAPFLLLGFLISGIVRQVLTVEKIRSWLGKNTLGEVFKASLFGVPLPLCSCSVIPTAVTLRKSGASTAATSSFLISTPESGIDSIAMTYSILDLPMTIFRPLAAFASAFVAGTLNLLFNKEVALAAEPEKKSCCHKDDQHHHHHGGGHKSENKILKILHFGFVELVDDMVGWLTFGIVLGSVISFVFPENYFLNMDQNLSKLLIVLIGIPLYICASASTPIAASLMLKGISPGAALMLLLVGPATNISNIAVLQKYIGVKGVVINVASVVGVALIASYLVDWFYVSYPLNIRLHNLHEHTDGNMLYAACGVVLVVLLLSSLYRVFIGSRK